MKKKLLLFGKIGAIGILALLLLIPLSMIGGLIKDRESYRHDAMRDVAQSWAERQKLNGPILVVPYERSTKVKRWDAEKKVSTEEVQKRTLYACFQPENLEILSSINTEERYKGIYTFPVYRSEIHLQGRFDVSELRKLFADPNVSVTDTPFLVVGIDDPRGISAAPRVIWNNTEQRFQPGTHTYLMEKGIHAILPAINPAKQSVFDFAFNIDLQGMSSFNLVPVGKETTIQVKANWPHPGFIGEFPPVTREITDTGFEARWNISYLANPTTDFFGMTAGKKFDELGCKSIGVTLVNPVDVYQITDRSVKYGFLFVVLTFTAFFLFEVLKNLRIHPVQYGLVGVALAMFFLLLVSLSEQISFGWSYLTASGACVGLLGFYVSHVLHSFARGLTFTSMLAALYGALYILLQMEDYALLAGSVMLFVLLALIMIITRRIDWYRVSDSIQEETPPPLPTT